VAVLINRNVILAWVPELKRIAQDAGQEIRTIYEAYQAASADQAAQFVQTKADHSPLTLADLAANQLIQTRLKALTPSMPIVSEEAPDSVAVDRQTGVFWLVDPLDGTREFVAGRGEFTVNIALVNEGEAVLGVVFAPMTGEIFWGGREFGAFHQEGSALRIHQPNDARWRVLASHSHLNEATRAFIDRMGATQTVQAGSSLKFCRIAQGLADAYPRLGPTCEWDTAAAQAVLEGAGGYVYDLQGNPLRYGKPDVYNPHFMASSQPFSVVSARMAQARSSAPFDPPK
jgi:3'(2'), 5'-bisphosphate nucleotidase